MDYATKFVPLLFGTAAGTATQALFGKKPPGPSAAEKAIQSQQLELAAEDRAEAQRLAALAGRATSRRKSLAFSEGSGTLG